MTPILMKSFAAIAAVASVAAASYEGVDRGSPYDGRAATTLTRADVAKNARLVFTRADADQDGLLNADEYAALSIVTAELAHLNGFIVVEKDGDDIATAPLPGSMHAALTGFEQARIEAVARNGFYAFAGDDGVMTEAEFAAAQDSLFDAADVNHNGALNRRELGVFAQRQAHMAIGA